MAKCFQSFEGHSVGVVLHLLQSRSNGWHTTLGLWGPWHTMGLPISFGQIATHSIMIPSFFGLVFYDVPKRKGDVHLLGINVKMWESQLE